MAPNLTLERQTGAPTGGKFMTLLHLFMRNNLPKFVIELDGHVLLPATGAERRDGINLAKIALHLLCTPLTAKDDTVATKDCITLLDMLSGRQGPAGSKR